MITRKITKLEPDELLRSLPAVELQTAGQVAIPSNRTGFSAIAISWVAGSEQVQIRCGRIGERWTLQQLKELRDLLPQIVESVEDEKWRP